MTFGDKDRVDGFVAPFVWHGGAMVRGFAGCSEGGLPAALAALAGGEGRRRSIGQALC